MHNRVNFYKLFLFEREPNNQYIYNIQISGKRRYNIKLWKTFTDCFNCLPVAAIVDEKIFCCHGKKKYSRICRESLSCMAMFHMIPIMAYINIFRWFVPWSTVYGANKADHAPNRCTRPRFTLWSFVVWSG